MSYVQLIFIYGSSNFIRSRNGNTRLTVGPLRGESGNGFRHLVM